MNKDTEMTDIPNTEYITINKDGIFVGGKPATTYRGKEIDGIDLVQSYFVDILKLNPDVTELHVLSSKTRGKWTMAGNPSGKHGPNTWCRVKFENGNLGAWVFYYTYSSAANCASICAYGCASYVRTFALFRSAVFGAANGKQNSQPKQNALTNALKDTDLSKFVGKPVQLNGYKIIIEKIAQDTKVKGK